MAFAAKQRANYCCAKITIRIAAFFEGGWIDRRFSTDLGPIRRVAGHYFMFERRTFVPPPTATTGFPNSVAQYAP